MQQATHALAAAPGLSTRNHRAALVVVINTDELIFLEWQAAHAAGVALDLQEIASGVAQGGGWPAPRAQLASLRGIYLPHTPRPVGWGSGDMVFTHLVQSQSP
jgi:hypothetical protein